MFRKPEVLAAGLREAAKSGTITAAMTNSAADIIDASPRTPALETMVDHMLQRWAFLASAERRTSAEESEVRRISDWFKTGGVNPEMPVREAEIVEEAPRDGGKSDAAMWAFVNSPSPTRTDRVVTYALGPGGVHHYVTDSNREALEAEVKRLRAQRSAEDERRDVLAHLREALARHDKAVNETDVDNVERLARLRSKVGLLQTEIAYIARGDHEGAADR